MPSSSRISKLNEKCEAWLNPILIHLMDYDCEIIGYNFTCKAVPGRTNIYQYDD